MDGVKANFGIRVQNAGCWYPFVEDRNELLPLLPRALTASDQYATPQSIDALTEEAQLIDVAGYSVVLVVPGDHTPKPCTRLTRAIMLTALKLGLDGFELRNHALLRSDSPDREGLGLVALPTEVGKPQEVESLRFSFSTPLPVTGRIYSSHHYSLFRNVIATENLNADSSSYRIVGQFGTEQNSVNRLLVPKMVL